MIGTNSNISFQGLLSRKSYGSREIPKIETGLGYDEAILSRLKDMLPTLNLTPGDAMSLEGISERGDKLTISSKYNANQPNAEITITTPQGDSLVLNRNKTSPDSYNDLVSEVAKGIKEKIEALQKVIPPIGVFRLDNPNELGI